MKLLIGVYNLPATITLCGLTSGMLACWLAMQGQPNLAVVALIWAGIFDLFDGMVARRIELSDEEVEFGMQLDSIVDMVSFGVAPVMIAYSLGVSGGIALVTFVFYSICAAQRLAYFNIKQYGAKGKLSHYTGLPVTFAALIFTCAFTSKFLLQPQQFTLSMSLLFLAVGGLFIADFKLPKPKKFVYITMPLLAVLFSIYWTYLALNA